MDIDRIEQFRFETLDKPDERLVPPLRAFFRRLEVGHIYDEVILPTLQEGSSLITVAIRDRPWPPWGIGAQSISALVFFHPIGEGTAGLGNVFVAEEEQTSIGLMAAVYMEGINQLAQRGVERVHFVVREEAPFSSRVLAMAGFERTSHPFLTEYARYWLHDALLNDHTTALGLQDTSTIRLLADEIDSRDYERTALFLLTLNLSFMPYWKDRLRITEVIPNTGIARVAECAPPGGPPKIPGRPSDGIIRS
jgi:hypothetical protein